jgi:hypothetical protein
MTAQNYIFGTLLYIANSHRLLVRNYISVRKMSHNFQFKETTIICLAEQNDIGM